MSERSVLSWGANHYTDLAHIHPVVKNKKKAGYLYCIYILQELQY